MKRVLTGALALILIVVFAACTPGISKEKTELYDPELAAGKVPDAIVKIGYPTGLPGQFANGFLDGVEGFSYESAATILSDTADDENANYSPISLWYALAVCAPATGGSTQEEFLDVLGADSLTDLEEGAQAMYNALYFDQGDNELSLANSIWIDDELNYKETYIEEAAEYFYTESFHVDLASQTDVDQMSAWVAKHTKGTLAPAFAAREDRRLSILNTVYFKDLWSLPFDEDQTYEQTFHAPSGDVETDFMHKTTDASYGYADGYIRASLEFENGCYMTFILPDEGVDVQDLLADAETIQDAFTGGTKDYGEVVWSVPKFSFEQKYDLLGAVEKLGIREALEDGVADFSGLTDGGSVYIANIEQGTFVRVSEKEVEASAYTHVGVEATAALIEDEPVMMTLDRPFLFGIFSKDGIPLFIGICNNPTLT
jgi:serpin B